MANIRVDVDYTIVDGSTVVFRSPVDCSAVTGLRVYYVDSDGGVASQEFVLADAHGNNVGVIDNLFAEDVVVKVILDVTKSMAFVQNADTNAYIERTFIKTINGVGPDANGNCDLGDNTGYETVAYGVGNATTISNAAQNGNPVYCVLRDDELTPYFIPMMSWDANTNTAIFGACYENKIITVTFADGAWSKSETAIGEAGSSDVFIGTEQTPLADYKAAFDSGKACFMLRDRGSDKVMYTVCQVQSSVVHLARTTSSGLVEYGYLTSSGTLSFQNMSYATEITTSNTAEHNYVPTAKAVKAAIDANTSDLKDWVQNGYAQMDDLPTVPEDIGAQPAGEYLLESALPSAINTALAQAKASGEFDGKDGTNGKDGTSVTVSKVTESSADGGSNVVTFSDGKTLTVKNGKTGSKGDDGNGIKSAVLNADYTLTLTFDDGTTYTTPSIRGATGATGGNGADGVSPTVAVSKSGKVTTVSITDKNGTKTATINDGADGSNGKDGTSVMVSNVTESSASGGTNTVTFSDGKTLNIKNGVNGTTPAKGTDYFTESDKQEIAEQASALVDVKNTCWVHVTYDSETGAATTDKTSEEINAEYESGKYVVCTLVDGAFSFELVPVFVASANVFFTGKFGLRNYDVTIRSGVVDMVEEYTTVMSVNGYYPDVYGRIDVPIPEAINGERGTSVLRITTAPTAYTTATGGFTPAYRIALSTVLTQSGASKVLVGDTVLRNYYTYPVGYVDASYVYLGKYASIRGSAGAAGADGTSGVYVGETAPTDETANVWINPNSGVAIIPTIEHNTCSIFKKVVCVGDSFTSGHIHTGESAVGTNEDYSWPSYMARLTGNEYVNCGSSGATTITWLTHSRGLAKAQSTGVVQAYLVGLGLNDANNVGGITLGTAADIGTDAQTYYAGMSRIVRELNAISPKAKIFLQTMASNSAHTMACNVAIRDVVAAYADTYPVHLLDLEAYLPMYKTDLILGDKINGHYTAIGYQLFAENLRVIWSEYINNHIAEFQDVYTLPYGTT